LGIKALPLLQDNMLPKSFVRLEPTLESKCHCSISLLLPRLTSERKDENLPPRKVFAGINAL